MEEVRGAEGKVRKKRKRRWPGKSRGSAQRWGLPPFLELPAEGWRAYRNGGKGEISRRPHDLFRPGGTCASQTLMAAITLPTHMCLTLRKERPICGKREN
ncbi:hypothetical protein PBY51_012212 [Eleginops maclovinus]|uniref:Uncharacterized protein n=1 Tax=Eleginops maclovinus TaxID=56733 RepID=A0AAN8APQ2_ELEMC|nr:hypothetical protein PBY51_012212 [Eleginops maclovinus]